METSLPELNLDIEFGALEIKSTDSSSSDNISDSSDLSLQTTSGDLQLKSKNSNPPPTNMLSVAKTIYLGGLRSPYERLSDEAKLEFRTKWGFQDDLSTLNEEQLAALNASIASHSRELKDLGDDEELWLIRPTWTQTKKELDNKWGFTAFRTIYDINHDDWKFFTSKFLKLVRKPLKYELAGLPPGRAADALRVRVKKTIDNAAIQWWGAKEKLEDISLEGARKHFRSQKRLSHPVNEFLSPNVFIVVDRQSYDSILPAIKSKNYEYGEDSKPFVWAVDGTFVPSQETDEKNKDYLGYYKVPVDRLLSEFHEDVHKLGTMANFNPPARGKMFYGFSDEQMHAEDEKAYKEAKALKDANAAKDVKDAQHAKASDDAKTAKA